MLQTKSIQGHPSLFGPIRAPTRFLERGILKTLSPGWIATERYDPPMQRDGVPTAGCVSRDTGRRAVPSHFHSPSSIDFLRFVGRR